MPTQPNTTQLLPDATLDARVEALLFATGSAMKQATLGRLLGVPAKDLGEAIAALKARLEGTGVALIEMDSGIALVTAPSVAETVASARKNQFSRDIGDAGLEVLAIILYRQKAARADIDYIRGVNSAATIRALSMRGLIERGAGKVGEPNSMYHATPALLAHLGVTHVSDLPEYESTLAELAEFEPKEKSNPSEPEDDISTEYDDTE